MHTQVQQFGGDTFSAARDGARLAKQYDAVFDLMKDGMPRTLHEIESATGYSVASISARLRDMRKDKFGGHQVVRVYIAKGLHSYRVIVAKKGLQ